jgi:response regulator RpfG family c-di-GMP phosphodiesterase
MDAIDKIVICTKSAKNQILLNSFFKDKTIFLLDTSLDVQDISKLAVDLVIIDDFNLESDIFEFIKLFRRTPNLRYTPLFIITKNLSKTYMDKLRYLGADNFILEPFDLKVIVNEIETAIKVKMEERKIDQFHPHYTQTENSVQFHEKAFVNKLALTPILEALKKKKKLSVLALEILNLGKSELTEKQVYEVLKRSVGKNYLLFSLSNGKYVAFLDEIDSEGAILLSKSILEIVRSVLNLDMRIGICSQKKPYYVNIQDMLKDAKIALDRTKNKGSFFEIFS